MFYAGDFQNQAEEIRFGMKYQLGITKIGNIYSVYALTPHTHVQCTFVHRHYTNTTILIDVNRICVQIWSERQRRIRYGIKNAYVALAIDNKTDCEL